MTRDGTLPMHHHRDVLLDWSWYLLKHKSSWFSPCPCCRRRRGLRFIAKTRDAMVFLYSSGSVEPLAPFLISSNIRSVVSRGRYTHDGHRLDKPATAMDKNKAHWDWPSRDNIRRMPGTPAGSSPRPSLPGLFISSCCHRGGGRYRRRRRCRRRHRRAWPCARP